MHVTSDHLLNITYSLVLSLQIALLYKPKKRENDLNKESLTSFIPYYFSSTLSYSDPQTILKLKKGSCMSATWLVLVAREAAVLLL